MFILRLTYKPPAVLAKDRAKQEHRIMDLEDWLYERGWEDHESDDVELAGGRWFERGRCGDGERRVVVRKVLRTVGHVGITWFER